MRAAREGHLHFQGQGCGACVLAGLLLSHARSVEGPKARMVEGRLLWLVSGNRHRHPQRGFTLLHHFAHPACLALHACLPPAPPLHTPGGRLQLEASFEARLVLVERWEGWHVASSLKACSAARDLRCCRGPVPPPEPTQPTPRQPALLPAVPAPLSLPTPQQDHEQHRLPHVHRDQRRQPAVAGAPLEGAHCPRLGRLQA